MRDGTMQTKTKIFSSTYFIYHDNKLIISKTNALARIEPRAQCTYIRKAGLSYKASHISSMFILASDSTRL